MILSGCASQPMGAANDSIFVRTSTSTWAVSDKYKTPVPAMWLPETEVRKLNEIVATKSMPLKAKVSQMLGLICTGKKAKVKPTYTVTLILPKFPEGTPIDRATVKKSAFIRLARRFLKERFIFNASRSLSPDAALAELDKPIVPALPGADEKSIQKFYASVLRFEPNLPHEDQEDAEQFPEESFLLIGVPNSQKILMVPKALMLIEPEESSSNGIKVSIENFGGHSKPSRNEWILYVPVGPRIHDGKSVLTALKPAWFADLSTYIAVSTLMLPKQFQQKHFSIDFRKTTYLGYNDDGEPSEEKANAEAETIWRYFLGSFSELSESPSTDGNSVNYKLSLDLNPLCEYGHSKLDLVVD